MWLGGLMARKLIVGTALVASALTTAAFAFNTSMQMTGAAFSEACTRADQNWISFCDGYIQAAVDSLREGDGICIPGGTTRTDLVTVMESAVTAVSQLQAMNAHEAVRVVMRHSYPC